MSLTIHTPPMHSARSKGGGSWHPGAVVTGNVVGASVVAAGTVVTAGVVAAGVVAAGAVVGGSGGGGVPMGTARQLRRISGEGDALLQLSKSLSVKSLEEPGGERAKRSLVPNYNQTYATPTRSRIELENVVG